AGRVRLHADLGFVIESPALFAEDVDLARLAAVAATLREHVERAASRADLDEAGRLRAALMRRPGTLAGGDAPFVALDADARIAFSSLPEQVAFEEALPPLVGVPPWIELPSTLDLLGLRSASQLLFVVVQPDPERLEEAA